MIGSALQSDASALARLEKHCLLQIMKVLVTGGSGFLGSYVVDLLLARGYAVRSLQRSDQPEARAKGVETVRGNLADAEAVRAAVKGCDAVFHVAAKAGVWGDAASFYSANVQGTRNVVAACRKEAVGRLVYTSTPSVVFNGEAFRGANESLPYGRNWLCHYAQTKAQAEREALAAHQPGTLHVCALRPHLIWGVGDPHLLPRVIDRVRAGRLRQVGNGTNKVDITHVRNAARAHLQAFDALSGEHCGGKAYFLSQGEPVVLWQWLRDLLQRLDLELPARAVPAKVAYAAGAVAEAVWRVARLKGEPPMTRFVAVELSKDHWYSIEAARKDFGYHPEEHPTEQGVAEYVAHLRATRNQ